MIIRTLIVDDEPLARSRLRRLLSAIDLIEIIGEATDGEEAVSMVESLSPNLIFMDIQMPRLTGVEAAAKIMKSFSDDPPAIIFCTAYDQYAIEAFKVNASDYLLKPVSSDDLTQAIKRACQVSQLRKPENRDAANFLPIKHLNYVENRPMNEVLYFRSEGKYVVVGVLDEEEIVVDSTLKELEEKYFQSIIRVHRNSLVSRDKLKKMVRNDGCDYVELQNCSRTFVVSRRMLNDVKKCFT